LARSEPAGPTDQENRPSRRAETYRAARHHALGGYESALRTNRVEADASTKISASTEMMAKVR
jgi:hypothetical protein